ncbi:MAG: hypothetical protein LRZ84_14580 [Desertifilum sp.]|nr:hypothetical protein [Desertifilum sp.]
MPVKTTQITVAPIPPGDSTSDIASDIAIVSTALENGQWKAEIRTKNWVLKSNDFNTQDEVENFVRGAVARLLDFDLDKHSPVQVQHNS